MRSSVIAILGAATAVNAAAYNTTVTSTTTASSYYATSTPSCAAPGTTNSKGQYSCNPAHSYPGGQTCDLVDGCYILCSSPGKPATTSYPATTYPATSSYPAKPTASCPAPGSTDSKGRYSCNPAHAYPAGQTCDLVEGCYYLTYPKSSSSYSATPPAPTVSCPAPGSTDSKGRYSCNPAHAYPAGQTCNLVEGCYYLTYPKTNTTSTGPKPSNTNPVYTGAASTVTAFGGLAALVAFAVLAL